MLTLGAATAERVVDLALCTHLHADHVAWNTRAANGRWVPTFPDARYLASRGSWTTGRRRRRRRRAFPTTAPGPTASPRRSRPGGAGGRVRLAAPLRVSLPQPAASAISLERLICMT